MVQSKIKRMALFTAWRLNATAMSVYIRYRQTVNLHLSTSKIKVQSSLWGRA